MEISATGYLTTKKPHNPMTSSNVMPPIRMPPFMSEMTSKAKSAMADDDEDEDGRGRGGGGWATGGVEATMLLPLPMMSRGLGA